MMLKIILAAVIILVVLGVLIYYLSKQNVLDKSVSTAIDSIYSGAANAASSAASGTTGAASSALAEWQKQQTQRQLENLGIVVGGTIALSVSRKILTRVGLRISKQYAKIIAKSATSIVTKIASKLGVNLITKLGLKSSAVTAKIASKAAMAGARVSMAGGATIAFEVLSLTMDILDVGGYGEMNTLEYYTVLKQTVDDQMKSAMAEAGEVMPIVVGPLDALIDPTATDPSAAYVAALNTKITTMMSDPKDPSIAPLIAAVQGANLKTDAEVGDFIDKNFDKYVSDAALEDMTNRATASLCADKGGMMVNGNCSYKKAACNTQYKWPRTDADTDTYTEWDGTACVQASPAVRTTCESAGLVYDQDARQCKVTEAYCRGKGAQWAFNSKLGAYDCSISRGQEIAEMILGTTVTRGLVQVFDPAQYEPCPSGWKDLGYSCTKSTCPDGKVYQDGMCYTPCKSGYYGAATMCIPECPPGYRNDGLYCYKTGARGTNYGRGAGRIPDVSCDPGWNIQGIGTASWCDNGAPWYEPWNIKTQDSHKSCYNNEEMNGGLCYPKCDAGYHADGCCVCAQNCPAGMTDIGISCQKNTYDRGIGNAPKLELKFKGRAIPYSKGDPAANAKALGDSVSQMWNKLGK